MNHQLNEYFIHKDHAEYRNEKRNSSN